MTGLQPAGLSHSEIPGSKVICTYPGLIAAYHVLHRLREPRHPPCALSYFLRLPCNEAGNVAHTFSCCVILILKLNFLRIPILHEHEESVLHTVLLVSICQRSCAGRRRRLRASVVEVKGLNPGVSLELRPPVIYIIQSQCSTRRRDEPRSFR